MRQLEFKDKTTISQGRNGLLNTKGIQIYISYDRIDSDNSPYKCIRVYPITSRDVAGNCWLELPIESIPDFIKELEVYVQSQPG